MSEEKNALVYRNLWMTTMKELLHLKSLISNSIVNQKTEIGRKALQQIIEEHNKWILEGDLK